MHFLLKAHLCFEWRQRSWMSLPDRTVMDQLTHQQRWWRMLPAQNSEVRPDLWVRMPRQRGAKSWSNIEDQVIPLERHWIGHSLAGLLLERQFEEVLWSLGCEKVLNSKCLGVHRKQGCFLSVSVDDIKMAGKKHNMTPMSKKLMKNVDRWLTNMISWSCTLGMHSAWMQTEWRYCGTVKRNVWITCFCWRNWKFTGVGKPHANTVAWSYDMEGHARTRVERYCKLAIKKTEQLYNVSSPCFDEKVALKSSWNACSWHALLGPTFYTQACDRGLARLTSYTHHLSDYRQHFMWATRLSNVDWVYSKTQILLATLRTQNQQGGRRRERGIFCLFGKRAFVPIRWMCKKETSVSHSSAESEIISLDAGLRMDGSLALDLWDVVIEVLRSTNETKTPTSPASGNRCETGDCSRNTPKTKLKGNRDVERCHIWITFLRTHILLLKASLRCTMWR